MNLSRRSFFAGMAAAFAAPAIVRSGILMPLRGVVMPPETTNWLMPFSFMSAEEIMASVNNIQVWNAVFAAAGYQDAGARFIGATVSRGPDLL